MEIIIIVLILMSQKKSLGGFSQIEEENKTQVFFLNENEQMNIVINGFDSGVRGSGLLYVDPCHKTFFVEYFFQGQKIGEQWVDLAHPKIFVVGPEEVAMPKVYPL